MGHTGSTGYNGQLIGLWFVPTKKESGDSMSAYTVPDALEARYKGDGMALAATQDGQLLALTYLSDLLPGVELVACDAAGHIDAAILDNPRIAPAVRELSALGSVHLGVCSRWEFVEL